MLHFIAQLVDERDNPEAFLGRRGSREYLGGPDDVKIVS